MNLLGSRFLPHDTRATTCPPGPLVSGPGPLIIVPSIMRSGTHLLLDALFNNFSELRRRPLFVDFDAYERSGLDPQRFRDLQGATIKSHFPQTPLGEPYVAALRDLAYRAIIISPRRDSARVRQSLAKWDYASSETEFAEVEKQFLDFWRPFSPVAVEFSELVKGDLFEHALRTLSQATGLKPRHPDRPVMAGGNRARVYCDKILTRLLGSKAPRINTTIGYRLSAARRS